MDKPNEKGEENLSFSDRGGEKPSEECDIQDEFAINVSSKQYGNIDEIDKSTVSLTDETLLRKNPADSNTLENIETEIEPGLRRSRRQKMPNYTDRGSVENEEIYRQKRSLGGCQGRVTAIINHLNSCIANGYGPDEIMGIIESLENAWKIYNTAYGKYISKNLAEEELARVEEAYSNINKNHASSVCGAQEWVRQCQLMAMQQQAMAFSSKSVCSKSVSSKSSKSSKGKKARMEAELKRLAAIQAEEDAMFESEFEKKKIEIDFKIREKVRKLKAEAALAERKAELMQDDDSDDLSNLSSPNGENRSNTSTRHPLVKNTQLTKIEQTELWAKSCPSVTSDDRALNDFEPTGCVDNKPKLDQNRNDTAESKTGKNKHGSLHDSGATGCDNPKPEVSKNQISDAQTVMLKINMLQAMQPVKFDGNPADFPTFRKRLIDNLEDGILNDSQKVEFLPKFVSGEAYETVKRVTGCSYPDIVAILQERYGQPARVAASCIESLISGPKLTNTDYTGLCNFAEQLTSSAKRLDSEYEQEASTTSNLNLIAARLPTYLINKWGNASYSIRESGRKPRLKDLAQFVKRQAAIKNDPAFIQSTTGKNTDVKPKFGRWRGRKNEDTKGARETLAYTTDFEKKRAEEGRDKDNNNPRSLKPKWPKCPCCSRFHQLAFCPEFNKKDLNARWEVVKKQRLCHVCMKVGHFRENCRSTDSCPCDSQRKHHVLLHNTKLKDGNKDSNYKKLPEDTEEREKLPSDKEKKTEQYATITNTASKLVLLHVVPVQVVSPEGASLTTYALLDNASRGTMISAELAKELNLKGRKETILVNTLLQQERQEFEVVEFDLRPASSEGEKIKVKEGLVSEKFNIAERYLPKDIDRNLYPHLADLDIPDVTLRKVSVLIGKDVEEAHEVIEIRKSKKPGRQLQGQRGPLGWVITGTLDGASTKKDVSINYSDCDRTLHKQIENFWNIEGYGTRTSSPQRAEDHLLPNEGMSKEDERAQRILEKTFKMKDGHYETGLLWKDDDTILPDNRRQAEKRLEGLKRRFKREPDLEKKYRSVMEDYFDKGYARRLSPNEVLESGPRKWYLPHFPVLNPNKPGKVRIVFDAAAEVENTSLNKNLLQGPDRTNSLVGVLLRFRQENVGIAADIESMFHQVKVCPEDQDSLRFLWWPECLDEPPEEYVMTVHIFGATDSPCAANSALKKTADDNEADFDPEIIITMKRNFYVDDLLKSLNTTEEAIHHAEELIKLCEMGGFNLTKFMSNDRDVLSSIAAEKRADPNLDLSLDKLPIERALGTRWNLESDELGFKVTELKKPDTMRGVLSTICTIFDPLNLAAPVMLVAKKLMQELWRKKYSWDQPLEGEILRRWQCWKESLHLLSEITIPRCYYTNPQHEGSTLELHNFSDASEVGYGSVAYLRISYPDGKVECSFVAGKARNAPIRTVTIPRLELQAAVLAARMSKSIRMELELDIKRVLFWTDSMITLSYINNETRRFQTYVSNRIAEIHELTTPVQWRHCPGAKNPADDASRGLEMPFFQQNERWLSGPTFLLQPEEEWPKTELQHVPETSLELKKEVYAIEVSHMKSLDELIEGTSQWPKCLRKVAWIQKFVKWFEGERKEPQSPDVKKITLEDLENARRKVVKLVQKQAFKAEITKLAKGLTIKASRLASLKPILDEEAILRVGGRISKAPISRDAANPMILPRKHHVTEIYIRFLHEQNGHCGHEQVLALSRECCWILKGRAAIRGVLNGCIKCKRRNAVKQEQEMAELPKFRLTPYEPAFTYTGVDCFGPFFVKRGRGKTTEKRWGVIFTCMNSRAVHLEVARSLEADDFILVLIRFLNRRGHVKEIRSDNGTNFVGAEREVREAIEQLDETKINNELSMRGCKWVFHPPGASHMSGVWERLVRTVKRSLKAIVGKDLVNEEVLQTVFTEAERIANARPLTRNPLSPNDDEPLTPNHFLNVRPAMYLPPEIISENDQYSKKKWRRAQLLANHYWKRWLREYIPTLQERKKWTEPKRNLRVNDLVLIADDNVPRNTWPMGKIVDVFPGPDGQVRTVDVRAKNSVYRRPVAKVCLLEAADNQDM